ncbi:MAG: hypothetical protein J5925_07140 [Clostridia bacterium]|nr:hypothetical protein [Clostridia bacterium]
MQIPLDPVAESLISRLESQGYSAYAVGGAVRDSLLGREVNDTDIATSAAPAQVKKALSGVKIIDTGIKHGTVTAAVGGKAYEITTYRVESGYRDSRHPDSVTFVHDIVPDLARRDFTVNAMAYSPLRGFCDPFCGREDLAARVIRAVGDPQARFTEDALRILRALRFASVLGFSIERETAKALSALAYKLKDISAERVYAELKALLCGASASQVAAQYADVLSVIAPVTGSAEYLNKLPPRADMRFACFYGAQAAAALLALRADKRTVSGAALCAGSLPLPADETGKKRFIAAHGRASAALVAAYRRALYGEDAEGEIERLIASGGCFSVAELDIKGGDLRRLGFTGEAIGRALSSLLDSVLCGETANKKEALAEAALRLPKNGVDNSKE